MMMYNVYDILYFLNRSVWLNKFTKCFDKYKEIIMYIIFGVLTTVVNFAVYLQMNRIWHQDELLSNAVAWIISVLFAYITNKLYVFENRCYSWSYMIRELSKFIFARLTSGVVDMFILWLGVYQLGIYDIIVKIFIGIFIVILNYLMSKFWIFNDRVGL